jgi:hypothetical protein
MAPWAGFEPATFHLGGGCSILLSYQGSLQSAYLIVFKHHSHFGDVRCCPQNPCLQVVISGASSKAYHPRRTDDISCELIHISSLYFETWFQIVVQKKTRIVINSEKLVILHSG